MIKKLLVLSSISILPTAFGADLFDFPAWLTPQNASGTYHCVLGDKNFKFTIDADSRTMQQTAPDNGGTEIQSGFFNTRLVNAGTDSEVFFMTIDYITAEGLGFSNSGKYFKPGLNGPKLFDSCTKS